MAGSKAIFTAPTRPGLIYDLLNVNPKSLAERRADWVKVVKVWNRIAEVRDGSGEQGRSRQDHGRARGRSARRSTGRSCPVRAS